MSDYITQTKSFIENGENLMKNVDNSILAISGKNNINTNGFNDTMIEGLFEGSDFEYIDRRLPSHFQLFDNFRMKTDKVTPFCRTTEESKYFNFDKSYDISPIKQYLSENRFSPQLRPIINTRSIWYDRSTDEYEANVSYIGSPQEKCYFKRISIDPANTTDGCQENNLTSRFPVTNETIIDYRERNRKEKHNKLEKKRRSFINDKIAELGNLLPDSVDRLLRQRKWSILKETVDYVKTLRKDIEMMKQLEFKIIKLDVEFRQMAKRVEYVESRRASHLCECCEQIPKETSQEDIRLETFQQMAQPISKINKKQVGNTTYRKLTFTSDIQSTVVERGDDEYTVDSSRSYSDTLCNFF